MKRYLFAAIAVLASSSALAGAPIIGCNLGLPGRHFECDHDGQYCKCVVDDAATYPYCEVRVMYRWNRPDEPHIIVPLDKACGEFNAAYALQIKVNQLLAGERFPQAQEPTP